MKRLALVVTMAIATAAAAQGGYWEVGLNGCWQTPNGFNMLEYSEWAGGFDVAYARRIVSNDYGTMWRRYPTVGVRASLEYVPHGISGSRLGVVGLLRAPLWGRLDYSLAAGISAFSRSRFITHDTSNIFVSSLLCCLVDVGVVYNVSNSFALTASFLHSSNGNMVRPNKGLNFLQLGVAYRLGVPDEEPDWRHARQSIDTVPPYCRHELGFTLSPGFSTSRHTRQEGLYLDYDISLNYRYYHNPLISTGLTVDLWFNGSHWTRFVWYDEPYYVPVYVSAMLTIEGHWGPVSIGGGVGSTLLASSMVDMPLYERLGVYYNWGNNLVGVAINAHGVKAEFIEWSYGRRFGIR